jgi:N-acetylglucosaminyl-diphospho-decaprenol L-rhamnosyltransferase
VRPSVAVAIVNWNTSDVAGDAAAAYLASTGVDVRVTIVDNHSSAEQRERLKATAPPRASVVWGERNRGYGWAVNSVLNASRAQVVCASNADVLVDPEMLSRLAAVVLSDQRIGVAAPCFAGSSSRYHARLPRGSSLPVRALIGGWGHRTVVDLPTATVQTVDQPGGACLLLRSDTWRAVGGFDTGFFLWFEDVDLARRLVDSGHRNVVVGDARAHHQGARSFVQMDRRLKHAIRLRSLTRYVAKHHPRLLPVTRLTAGLARATRVRSRALAAEARALDRQVGAPGEAVPSNAPRKS